MTARHTSTPDPHSKQHNAAMSRPSTKPSRTYSLWPILFLALGLIFAPASQAVDSPDEMLPDPAMEHQAQQIGQQLRCLVCQNESIEESSAPLARDLRQIVRQQLREGHNEKEIDQWMTARYGEFIRLRPALSPSTALLWLMPLLGLMLGGLLTYRLWHRPPRRPAPLTPAELRILRQKLDSLPKKD